MKIKDYKCKCGENDFFFDDKGNQKGIYCSYCGRWLKWASKDEQNLDMKQEPCEDAIDRAEAITEIMMFAGNVKSDEEDVYIKVSDAVQLLRELPPVTPQPKMGKWMRKTKVDGVYDIAGVKTWGIKCQCDRCDFTTTVIEDFGYYTYCPNCGAKMESEIHCNFTDAEISKSFIEDVEAVKDLLPRTESEE